MRIVKKKAKKGMKLPKQKTLAQLKKDLTKVFNAFIRQRDSLPNGTFKCISSGKVLPVSQMHAGHFHPAGSNSAIRWHEKNVNGQSIHDNYYKHGNPLGYQKGIVEKYGMEVLEELEMKRHQPYKPSRFDLEILISHYKQKLK